MFSRFGEPKQFTWGLLILVSVFIAGCGGLTKQEQADAYLVAANQFNAGLADLNASSEPDLELFYLHDYAGRMSELVLEFVTDIKAIEWTNDYSETAKRLAACDSTQYELLREVTRSTNVDAARIAWDEAEAQWLDCHDIANEMRTLLGLAPAPG